MLLVAPLLAAALCQGGGLVVVAPERFHEALGGYVEHRRKQLTVELLSLEAALQTDGADDPERLKRRLYDAWKNGARYALLVGDSDVLPVRYMVLDRNTPAAFDYAFYPSDLYYADLAKPDGAFDDWNARKDGFHAGYVGEVRGEHHKKDPINYDAIDYRPDIAVGRWPVSTVDELKIVAAKTIAYELGKPAARAALVHVDGWVDARPRLDKLAASLAPWSVDKLYKPTEPALVKLLNEGVGLICHAGHGNDDVWEGCLSVKSLDRVKNADALPVMMSAGCSTARFAVLPPYEEYVDVHGKEHAGTNNKEEFKEPPPPPSPYQGGKYARTGLGEQLLRRGPGGAVAYIGCNTGSQPCGLTLLEGFVEAFAKEERLGDAWSKAVAAYWDREKLADLVPTADWYPASIFFQGMKFMLFGDPSLRLRR